MTATGLLPRDHDEAPSPARRERHWLRWFLGAVVVAALLVVGAPFVYIHFVEGPAPAVLELADAPAHATPAIGSRTPLAGRWRIGPGSVAGYRVEEKLFGQPATAVGRTDRVTGAMTVDGTRVTSATFRVDLASVTSARSARDSQFRERIMNTARYPAATFALTDPIALAPVPPDGVVTRYSATGRLTLHGTTRSVTIPLTARQTGATIEVQGILTVTFGDFGIDNPSLGPAHVGGSGQLEFVLRFRPDDAKETP